MTSAVCKTLERNPVLNYAQFLDSLRNELMRGGYDQVMALTSSQPFDISKQFSLCDGIEGNQNQMLGRHFRKKKHPRRESLLHGGLGEILEMSAVGFMVSDLVGDAVGGLVVGGMEAGDMLAGGG